jgi:hypothetical protein
MQQRHAGIIVPSTPVEPPVDDAQTIGRLEARVAHLERLVEGLQDAMHREETRQNRRIMELEARTEPSALAVALNRDERQRGL